MTFSRTSKDSTWSRSSKDSPWSRTSRDSPFSRTSKDSPWSRTSQDSPFSGSRSPCRKRTGSDAVQTGAEHQIHQKDMMEEAERKRETSRWRADNRPPATRTRQALEEARRTNNRESDEQAEAMRKSMRTEKRLLGEG